MLRILSTLVVMSLVGLMFACSGAPAPSAPSPEAIDEELRARAEELAQRFIIVDGHVDLPYRLEKNGEDVSQRTEKGDFDYPRARAGGLNAPFMAIYTPSSLQEEGGSKELADKLIDIVERLAAEHPDKFAIATSPADIRRQFEEGKLSLPLGMENGAPIEDDLANLGHFHDRGVRYITLAHATSNLICDAAYGEERVWQGLSPFGREVVAEMNRLGIMVDITHVTDKTFHQVMELSQAPVIASHSSCRSFTPGWERNMDDEMISLLGEKGGVIMINFGSSFVNEELRQEFEARWEAVEAYLEEHNLERDDEEAQAYIESYRKEHPSRYADISEVLDHIDHVVELAGVDHVGFGSDFDGLGDSLPIGLKDVSAYPNLIYGLLKRGYSEEEIEKICSGNVLRVWAEVERVAAKLQASDA